MSDERTIARDRVPVTAGSPQNATDRARRVLWRAGRSRRVGGATGAARAQRIVVLDGLRLLAALSVVLFHYLASYGTIPWQRTAGELFPALHRIAQFGWLGVAFFFMISGFVICMSGWGKSLGHFWQGRVLRLFPLYWAAVVLSSAAARLGPHVPGEPKVTFGQMLTNLTMLNEPLGVTHVDNVYWTLWVELRFYLLFSLVVLLGSNYRRVATFCWIWALGSVMAPASGIPLLEQLVMPRWAPFFIAGIAFYLVRRAGRLEGETVGILALSWLLMQHRLPEIMAGEGHGINWKVCLSAVTVMYLVMCLIALGKLDRIQWRWLPIAGVVSYPLYLVHQSLGVRVIWRWNEQWGAWPTLLGVIAGMVLFSWLLHRVVERPLARLLRQAMGPRREQSQKLAA
ncbi:acyltransferase [Streptomyces sp. PCS3-D2]|uniref:acyltransferase family protein n=1 Tax=Streptomyces sp. PCS3-D2 TaxID=1460244 RepID=UPI00044E10A7|nr:acyltransferase [Streptomyces sp. PCS3-D2]WKV71005.1 acyltransferase [Streptomyces sp. PCS3-D2]